MNRRHSDYEPLALPTELPRQGKDALRVERALIRAPIRNRTVDLLLTMETLCRLSYWGRKPGKTTGAVTGRRNRPVRPAWEDARVSQVGAGRVARTKNGIPPKTCERCGRPFEWRRKWARDWDQVRYCSERCRRG